MATIDRTLQPALNPVDNFILTKANKIMLDNGMPMYVIDAGTHEVCKIELLINAGMDKPTNPILAQVACELADDGTSTKTAYDIAETVEFYGASLETNIEFHNASFCLTTLTRHLPNLLPDERNNLRCHIPTNGIGFLFTTEFAIAKSAAAKSRVPCKKNFQ